MTIVFMLGIVYPRAFAEEEFIKEQGIVDKAHVTFHSFMDDENMTWIHENLNNIKGIVIIPEILKGGFIIGGSGGTGVLFVRDEKTGTWSQPAFYTIGSLSVGLQIGAEKAEILMAIKTQKGVESFYKTTFRLGGDVSLAAGPGGAGAKTNITADIVSFAKTKGAFAGVSLEGAVVKTDYDANKNYYGQSVQPVDIIVKGEVSSPGSEKLREALRKASMPSPEEAKEE
jgi:lipid-binding SYLF domain-containing protein